MGIQSWLSITFEALIHMKLPFIWTADREDWHDADWKNAVNFDAIDRGATVVPRE